MKQWAGKHLILLAMPILIVACSAQPAAAVAIVTVAPTSTAVPHLTNTPRPSPTATPTAAPTLRPGVTIEFGERVRPDQKEQITRAAAVTISFFKRHEFGDGGQIEIYASTSREDLANKSYSVYNSLTNGYMSEEDYITHPWGWGNNPSSINLMSKDMEIGHAYINLSAGYHPPWFAGVTDTECLVATELTHLYHQWLTTVNLIGYTNGRPGSANGPDWLLFSSEFVVCGFAYSIPEDVMREVFVKHLASTNSCSKKFAVVAESLTDGNLLQAGGFFLVTQSPGGKEHGINSLGMFYKGLTDPNKTWSQVFEEVFGWTPKTFFEQMDEHCSTLVVK